MTFVEAAIEVLRREGRPLHYERITELAVKYRLLSHVGKNPEATMATRLALQVRGSRSDSALQRVKPGVFTLQEWKGNPPGPRKAHKEEPPEEILPAESNVQEPPEEQGAPEAATPGTEELSAAAEMVSEAETEQKIRRQAAEQRAEQRKRQERPAKPSHHAKEKEREGKREEREGRPEGRSEGRKEEPRREHRREERKREESDHRREERKSQEPDSRREERKREEPESRREAHTKHNRPPAPPREARREEPEPRREEHRHRERRRSVVDLLEEALRALPEAKPKSLRHLAHAFSESNLDAATLSAAAVIENARRKSQLRAPLFTRDPSGALGLAEWSSERSVALEAELYKLTRERHEEATKEIAAKVSALRGGALEQLCAFALERAGFEDVTLVRRSSVGNFLLTARASKDLARPKVLCLVRCHGPEVSGKDISDLRGNLAGFGALYGLVISLVGYAENARSEATQTTPCISLFDTGSVAELVVGAPPISPSLFSLERSFLDELGER